MRWLPLVLLLWALPAWGGWSTTEAGTDTSCETNSPGGTPINPQNPNVCFYNLAQAATTASDALDISRCAWVDFFLDTNLSATTTGGSGTLYVCVSATESTNTCNPVYSDAGAVALTGVSSSGLSAIYGVAGPWIYFVPAANAAGALRAAVVCH